MSELSRADARGVGRLFHTDVESQMGPVDYADTVCTIAISARRRSGLQPSVGIQMPATIPSAALRHMTEAARTRVVDAAFDCGPEALRNYLTVLDARLRVFELRYELPTGALSEALASGKLRDTADVSEWLFWSHLRSDQTSIARLAPSLYPLLAPHFHADPGKGQINCAKRVTAWTPGSGARPG